uniref:Gag-Pol polyprotein n=1 Tax=Lygus hesperus TaxID=30085 RepID=A0A0A9YEX0_LYGHE
MGEVATIPLQPSALLLERSGRMFVIFIDSQVAFMSFNGSPLNLHPSTSRGCPMIEEAEDQCNEITFQWVPSHDGLLGNDKADALAREGSSKAFARPNLQPNLNL